MDAETEAVQIGKHRKLPSGEWYVHCKHCETEARLPICDEEEAYALLDEWRRSMTGRHSKNRNWSCPSCRTWWDEEPTTTETAETAATDAAGSAGQLADAAATSFDALQLEVVALKAEVVELKAEVERLKAEAHEHVAYQAAHDEEILARALQMVRREVTAAQKPPPAIPAADIPVSADDTRDAVDIAVPEDAEDISHDG